MCVCLYLFVCLCGVSERECVCVRVLLRSLLLSSPEWPDAATHCFAPATQRQAAIVTASTHCCWGICWSRVLDCQLSWYVLLLCCCCCCCCSTCAMHCPRPPYGDDDGFTRVSHPLLCCMRVQLIHFDLASRRCKGLPLPSSEQH